MVDKQVARNYILSLRTVCREVKHNGGKASKG